MDLKDIKMTTYVEGKKDHCDVLQIADALMVGEVIDYKREDDIVTIRFKVERDGLNRER